MLIQTIADAWLALLRSKTRTILTMLGVVWGIVTVTLLVAYGSSFRSVLVRGFEAFGRGAVVYVRQSTMGQVIEHTESRRRQYALAESARSLGFTSVALIDDDLGRSGSGLVERPGFQKLVAQVCSGSVGAVFCIEASRLARNGRD